MRKQRLTVTVDPELVEAGNRAVEAGEADSLSGWVSTAMSEKARRDEKLGHLRAAIAKPGRQQIGLAMADFAECRKDAGRCGGQVIQVVPVDPLDPAPVITRAAAVPEADLHGEDLRNTKARQTGILRPARAFPRAGRSSAL